MDMVWLDTMFPGIDEDSGWKENLERVVNYDYLLKEYLDWQLKHLSTDNFNPTDWSNIQEEIISMTAGQIDLTAYYTKDEADELYASLQLYADEQLASLSLAAVTSGGTAQLVLQSGGTTIPGSGAALTLSVTNNQNGYSTLALTADGVTLATSGNITLGGNVMFVGDDISNLNNDSGYQKRSGVVSIINGTVDADFVNALGITADSIVARASISAPTISGGTISGATIRSSTFYAGSSNSDYFEMVSGGFAMYTGGYIRAWLYQDGSAVGLRLGDSSPFCYVQKYYSGNTHYMWVGNSTRSAGLRVNLTAGTCELVGAA